MSFLARMQHGSYLAPRHGRGMNGTGVGGFVVDKGERYAASFGFGALMGHYRDSMVWRGIGADLWIGAGLTAASAAMLIASGGRSNLAPHLERIGDAGVMAYFHGRGASWGSKQAGHSVQVIEAPKKPGALPAPTVVGSIPEAARGSFLSAEEIASYTAPRR